jgi:lipoprotein-anchoring transpeptidase ErfK/SrfK
MWPALILILACLAPGALSLAGVKPRVLAASLRDSRPTATATPGKPWAHVVLSKPTYTPTLPPRPTPTSTVEETPTSVMAMAEIVPDTPSAAGLAEPAPRSDDLEARTSPRRLDKYILVDISEQHLYAYENNSLLYDFVASTGMNNATATGVFSVLSKIPNAYGATWNIWMPNWLGIYWAGGLQNGIHALPILSSGARLWAGFLGTPISYGCVVLGQYESQLLFDWADVGTIVEIQW